MIEREMFKQEKDNYTAISGKQGSSEGLYSNRGGIRKIYTCLLLLILFGTNLPAQTIVVENGYPVIDVNALTPLGIVLTSAESAIKRVTMNSLTASNTALLEVGIDVSGVNGTWNAKVSPKFQVMRANHTVGSTNWANAYNQCKTYNGEGGGASEWRLPTQRELVMIWILHPQLVGKGGFTGFLGNYWSAAEDGASKAWNLNFTDGYVNGSFGKTSSNYVRCVRDFTPPVAVVTITQSVANAYKAAYSDLTYYPPFNYDGGVVGTLGSDYKGKSSDATISTPYSIEVEKTERGSTSIYQPAIDYCKGKGSGWRLPTQIELFAMYQNKSKLESISGFAAFVSHWYRSSSVSNGYVTSRSALNFTNGDFGWGFVSDGDSYVRCVRDI